MSKIREQINKFGVARVVIIALILVLLSIAFAQKQDMNMLITDAILRFGMNCVLTLAMVPSISSGTGLNFGLPVGVIAGLLGALVTVELGFTGMGAIFAAMLIALPFAMLLGYLYGLLLNAVKGSEMVVGTYVGYSIVSLMCIAWCLLPFKSGALTWPLSGKGLRVTISLENFFAKILTNSFDFNIGGAKGIHIPTGLLLVCFTFCIAMWLFTRSKTGVAMKAAGDNPVYAKAVGINVDRMRIIGTAISTCLAAMGIILYAQSFGFLQLYLAPLNMAFAPVAAILIGGASTRSAKVSHVILGTFLFQSLLTMALPVANTIAPEGGLAEISRLVVSYSIILYALTQGGKKK